MEEKKPRKEPLSIDSIVERVTKGLIPSTDGESTYKPIHLKASSKFIQELQTGEWVYNIIHAVPTVGKTTYEFLEKLSSQLVSSGKANEGLNELARRLRDDLSEEDVNALFREYKDSDLKNHLNNPINIVIIDRLKSFGLDHIQRIHLQLQRQYTSLYSLLGQIKPLEEKIGSGRLSENDRYAYLNARRQYIGRVAGIIKKIEEERKAVSIILSSGIPGIEAGYQKENYPFIERGNVSLEQFDPELKERYHEYQEEFEEALEKNNPDTIVSGFMGLESCSFRQNDVARSLVGRKSVGTKYFSSFAREFYYQDDVFAKDLFTMVSDSVAVVGSYYQNFNASNFEAFRYYQDIMGRYGKGMISPEKVVSSIQSIAQESYDNLERVVDESSSIIDVSEIRSNLGSLIKNPIDILSLPEMNALPKDDRDRLLFAFASCTFAVQVATLMDHKYSSLTAQDMVRDSEKDPGDKGKVY